MVRSLREKFELRLIANIESLVSAAVPYIKHVSTLLDIGCGSGMTALTLSKYTHSTVTCLDVADYRHNAAKNLMFVAYDGVRMPFTNNRFDVCWISFVLHHASNPDAVINEGYRVAKQSVIVLEEVYDFGLQKYGMILYDMVINAVIFGDFVMRLPKFRSTPEWMEIFDFLKPKEIKIIPMKTTWWQPFRRVMFVISKTAGQSVE